MSSNINLTSKALVAGLVVATVGSLQAQEADDAIPALKNRFGLSYRASFNVRASFSQLGGIPSLSNPGSTASGQDHTYDDGYVKQDSRGVNDGYTWNWGYQSQSQVPGNDTIQFHKALSQGDAELKDNSSDPQHGMELTYERWLGRVGKSGNWGLALAFNYANVGIGTDRTAWASALTDTYALNGVVPPEPPYAGDVGGPGPLISDTPSRSFSRSLLVSGRHELDADLFGFRVGPYIEFPFAHRWTANFSAGLALAVVSSDFRFNETASVSGVVIGSTSGANSRTDVLYGAYVGANLYYAINPRWSLVGGVEYQTLSDFKQSVGGREAKLDFSSTVFLKGGVSFSF